MMDSSVLVSGVNSGIGKYIHEQIGGHEFTRQSANVTELKREYFQVIIHCANNSTSPHLVTNLNLDLYYYDNVLLTQELLQIPHEYFVFFSTVDVYPLSYEPHFENEIINTNTLRNIYATTKMISESLVRAQAPKFLILRPTSLFGSSMRKNNLVKLFEDPNPSLTLDETSLYNVILYSDILEFILLAIKRELRGIFNLASSSNVTLAKIAEIVSKNPVFGKHHYEVGNIVNFRAAQIQPRFNISSEDIVNEILAKNKPQ